MFAWKVVRGGDARGIPRRSTAGGGSAAVSLSTSPAIPPGSALNDSGDWHSCASANGSEDGGLESTSRSLSFAFHDARSPENATSDMTALPSSALLVPANAFMELAELPDSPWINVTSPARGYMQPRRSWPFTHRSSHSPVSVGPSTLSPSNYSFHLPPDLAQKVSSTLSPTYVPSLEFSVGGLHHDRGREKTSSAPASARESEMASCPLLPIERKHWSPKAKAGNRRSQSKSPSASASPKSPQVDRAQLPVQLSESKTPSPKRGSPQASPVSSPMPAPSSSSPPSSPSTSPTPSPEKPPKGGRKGAPPKGLGKGKDKGKGKSEKGAKAEPRKPDVKPGVQVKKLFWNSFRIDSAQNTVWNAIEEEGAQIDTKQLETLFCDEPQRGFHRFASPSPEGDRPTVKRVQVVDTQRRRQVCVMLARLPPPPVAARALLHMDSAVLNTEQVELLHSNLPSEDEIKLLRKAKADHTIDELHIWDTAEDFLLALIAVPQFEVRLRAWHFENSFEERFDALADGLRSVLLGCSSVLDSRCIRHLLGIVLYAGNYLNGGTPRGRADGFSACWSSDYLALSLSSASSITRQTCDHVRQC